MFFVGPLAKDGNQVEEYCQGNKDVGEKEDHSRAESHFNSSMSREAFSAAYTSRVTFSEYIQ